MNGRTRTLGIALLALQGCMAAAPPVPPTPKPSAAVPAARPSGVAPALAAGYRGRVLGLDGAPAAGVAIAARIVSNNGASVVSNNGGALTTAGSNGTLISDHGAGYRLVLAAGAAAQTRDGGPQAEELATTTDAAGRFALPLAAGATYHVEATQSAAVKAIGLGVTAASSAADLQLARVGTLAGRIASDQPGVTDLEGATVFIPGTRYLAVTDRAGAFRIEGVPVGRFELVARQDALGRGVASVEVRSDQEAAVETITLSQDRVLLEAVEPAAAGPGATVTLRGRHFGASANLPFQVAFPGALALDVERVDDATIRVRVPTGATVGDLAVTVDGRTSNGLRFQPVKGIVLSAGRNRLVPGETLAVGAACTATDGAPAAQVPLSWRVAGEAFTVDAAGTLTAVKPGRATVIAQSGAVEGRLELEVAAQAVEVGTFPLPAGLRPEGVAVGPDGTVWVVERDGMTIRSFAADGTPGRTIADVDGVKLQEPADALAVGPDGTLFFADRNRIRTVTPAGVHAVRAGAGGDGYADGPAAAAKFGGISAFTLAADGTLYVAEGGNQRIRRVAADGTTTTLAGSGEARFADGAGPAAAFFRPRDLAVVAGGLFVADRTNSRLRRVDLATGAVTTPLGNGSPDVLHTPTGLVAFEGLLYVAEAGRNRILRVDPATGTAEPFAGSGAAENKDGRGTEASLFLDGDPAPMAIDPKARVLYVVANHAALRTIRF